MSERHFITYSVKDHPEAMVSCNPVLVSVKEREIEARMSLGGGPQVACVDVVHDDGQVSRFFINTKIKRGRAKVSVTVNHADGSVTKEVMGHKHRPRK